MASFPSVEWFDDVRDIFNNEESFRGGGGGQCNCVAGIKVGKQVFVLRSKDLSAPTREKPVFGIWTKWIFSWIWPLQSGEPCSRISERTDMLTLAIL